MSPEDLDYARDVLRHEAAAIEGRDWDLSSVRHVLNGAEAIVARTARRFMELLTPFGLSPQALGERALAFARERLR